MTRMTKSGGAENLSPMMQQWRSLKEQAGEALLFFRLGDFYELFFDDAETAAPVMGVTLTSRNTKGSDKKEPLCGIPIHHFEGYLHKLLDAGFSVALAEQTEAAGPQVKLVKREIVQWFTPGIRMLNEDGRPSYCGVVTGKPKSWSFAAADVATGHLVLETGESEDQLQSLVDSLPVLDLRIPYREKFEVKTPFQAACYLLSEKDSQRLIMDALHLSQWEDSPAKNQASTLALGTLVQILNEAHPQMKIRLLRPQLHTDTIWINGSTRRNLNLEISESGSFIEFLDQTRTAMGRRRLKDILFHPSRSAHEIRFRQQVVQVFKADPGARKNFRNHLHRIYDLSRLFRKKQSPECLLAIQQSLKHLQEALNILTSLNFKLPKIDSRFAKLTAELEQSLQPSHDGKSGWIRAGVNAELDELRELEQNASGLLSELEQKLRSDSSVASLKIKFHQVFGYIAEVSALHQNKIPSEAKVIQTLANSVRFKTEELKKLEEKLLSLSARLTEAEGAEIQRLFQHVRDQEGAILLQSEALSFFDVMQSFAEVSATYGWSSPVTLQNETQALRAHKAVHPLSLEAFVPLSFELESEEQRCLLLTGPNMAGKSTVLRMAALLALLHQVGSDVPAEKFEASIFDRILCRMGAYDDLIHGKSTFFVEMREVANMLNGATEKSLLLFDELGRGTSTYDGMSLAWAITESVHDKKALSMVATHYLEMAQLEKQLSALKNFHLGVKQVDNQLVFTRRLERGPASKSYGIQVARLADIPEEILDRASKKLEDFEKKRLKPTPLFESNLFYEQRAN